MIEKWRIHYNNVRPHSSLDYRPSAPESIVRMDQRPTMHYHSNRITQWAHATRSTGLFKMLKRSRARFHLAKWAVLYHSPIR